MSVALGTPPTAAPAGDPAKDPAKDRVETPFQRFVSEFAESKIALVGLAVFVVIAVAIVLVMSST
jgi:peptide/nickel transport system permease protein